MRLIKASSAHLLLTFQQEKYLIVRWKISNISSSIDLPKSNISILKWGGVGGRYLKVLVFVGTTYITCIIKNVYPHLHCRVTKSSLRVELRNWHFWQAIWVFLMYTKVGEWFMSVLFSLFMKALHSLIQI